MWGLPHDTRKRFPAEANVCKGDAIGHSLHHPFGCRDIIQSPLQYIICLRTPRLLVHLFYPRKPRSLTFVHIVVLSLSRFAHIQATRRLPPCCFVLGPPDVLNRTPPSKIKIHFYSVHVDSVISREPCLGALTCA